MRIFVSSVDQTGTRHNTRILLHNCTSTSQLSTQICKQFHIPRSLAIIKLKSEYINLVVVDNWPLQHYPIRSGTTYILERIQFSFKENVQLAMNLQKIDENSVNQQLVEGQTSPSYSSKSSNQKQKQSNRIQLKYSHYLDQCLNRMLEFVRNGQLEAISSLMREQPLIQEQKELQQLIKKKYQCLLNQNGDCGRNALHWAIHTKQVDLVSFLLIKGANTSRLTIDGYTPLQLAVQHHSSQIVQLLLQQHNFNLNQATKHGTALHLAVRNEDLKCIQIFLQNDCSLDILDSQGKSPLEVCKNQKIRQMFLVKAKMGKLSPVHIAKGLIYRVSTKTYRLKERSLLLNPFKNQFSISFLSGQIEYKYSTDGINDVQQLKEKNWLMKKHVFYFKLLMKSKQKYLLLATKHQNVLKRWIKNFRLTFKYQQYKLYIKPQSHSQQIIQFLDDERGQITHQSKIQQKTTKKTQHIMNLNYGYEYQQKPEVQKNNIVYNLEEKINCSLSNCNTANEDQSLKEESQIGQKPLLEEKKKKIRQEQQSTHSQISDSTYSKQPKTLEPVFINRTQQDGKIRKNSENMIDEKIQSQPKQALMVSYSDFQVIKLLGHGAFGKVYLARHKGNQKNYALKVLDKKRLFLKKQLKYAVGQASILKKIDSPFIVRLHYSFQTPNNLYMALDHCSLGDLSELIINREKLQQNTARFVIAQLVLAIQYLHKENILYRDLKPQNILIASDGYIQLTDFGLSRQRNFSISFCGSPAYLSPQMLQKKGVGQSTDIYGIGCVLYEMVVGEPPFFDETMEVLFSNILSGKLRFPSELSSQLKSLIGCLLERDIDKRLGVKHINEIKEHIFFKKFDWEALKAKKIGPPKEMFANFEEQGESARIDLQVKQQITLFDRDYTEATKMINLVKNFTYVRIENGKKVKSPTKSRKQTI